MKRLDVALVERGLAPTRSKAQQLISAGEVEILHGDDWLIAESASRSIKPDEILRVSSASQTLKYVSRGGLKLEAALDHLKLDVRGLRCLDVGLSTGGFTDVLLQREAESVIGIDVGRAQLHPRLKNDPRLQSFEGINVRDLSEQQDVLKELKGVKLVVVDVSFISLELVIPALAAVWPVGARFLALVKPQFEVGFKNLNGKGIVNDASLYDDVKRRMLLTLEKYGFSTDAYFASAVKGQDGNQEFFVSAHHR